MFWFCRGKKPEQQVGGAAGWCTGSNSTSLGPWQLVQVRVYKQNSIVQKVLQVPLWGVWMQRISATRGRLQPSAPQSAVDCGLNSSEVLAKETTYQLQYNIFIMLWHIISSLLLTKVATKGCWTVFDSFLFRHSLLVEREFWCFLLVQWFYLWCLDIVLMLQCKCHQIICVLP